MMEFIKKNMFVFLFIIIYIFWIQTMIGWRKDHFFLIALIVVSYFASEISRKFLYAFGAFILYWIIYDSMRIFPNYLFNDIHILQPYLAEKQWFGIHHEGNILTPNEFFASHNAIWADIAAGIFYINWVPVPLLFGLYLWRTDKDSFLHFTYVFLLTNLIGFIGYYTYPAAPPWYVELYGNVLHAYIKGNVGRLARFDDFFNVQIFHNIYSINANVFAAIPSLHSAYPAILVLFGLKERNKIFTLLAFIFALGIWVSAVYLNHHYVIDVILGICCAIAGYYLFYFLLINVKIIEKWFNFLHQKI